MAKELLSGAHEFLSAPLRTPIEFKGVDKIARKSL